MPDRGLAAADRGEVPSSASGADSDAHRYAHATADRDPDAGSYSLPERDPNPASNPRPDAYALHPDHVHADAEERQVRELRHVP